MNIKEHHNDTVQQKASHGFFARREYAILGSSCEVIDGTADFILKALSANYKTAYIDASHSGKEEKGLPVTNADGRVRIVIHEGSYSMEEKSSLSLFKRRSLLSEVDLALINGNHHEASAQIVIIDEEKKGTLSRRIDQLTNIEMIILKDEKQEVFDFIRKAIHEKKYIPVFQLKEKDKIISHIIKSLEVSVPELNGLVLAGGKSQRMGQDKTRMQWNGKEQRFFLADLLKEFCTGTYISCRNEQQQEIGMMCQTITDSFTGLGPFGAILSAFRAHPDKAWLVLACDLPLMDSKTIHDLILARDPSKISTAFESPQNGLPEPLAAIWEPKSYPALLSYLAQGISCPRKALMSSSIKLIKATRPEALTNVNTPGDLAALQNKTVKQY